MAIDNKVMLNAIRNELNKWGKTSRLLPKQVAAELWQTFGKHRYHLVAENTLSNGKTNAMFRPTNNDKVKITFTTV